MEKGKNSTKTTNASLTAQIKLSMSMIPNLAKTALVTVWHALLLLSALNAIVVSQYLQIQVMDL